MKHLILGLLLLLLTTIAAAAQASDPDTTSEPGFFASWDGRVRMRAGVARITLRDENGAVFPIYLTLNYRVSTHALPAEPGELKLGLGAEAGIFYLYPYALLGPELRYGDFYLELHGGATFIFLVGSDTPDGSGALVGGSSVGWIVGSPEVIHVEFQAGADAITMLKGSRATTWMPHVTAAFRF